MADPSPPKHLEQAGRALWRGVTGNYDMDPHQLAILERLHQHPGQRSIPGRAGIAGMQERTASVVQKPFRLHTSLEGSIGKPICLKVI